MKNFRISASLTGQDRIVSLFTPDKGTIEVRSTLYFSQSDLPLPTYTDVSSEAQLFTMGEAVDICVAFNHLKNGLFYKMEEVA